VQYLHRFFWYWMLWLCEYGGTCQSSWLRHYATSRKVAGSIPDEDIWPNPSSRTTALGSPQPLTEMSIRNLPGGKGRPARKADNLTQFCEPTVLKMWEPHRLTTLWASTTCYRDNFTFTFLLLDPITAHQIHRIQRDSLLGLYQWRRNWLNNKAVILGRWMA
jgi:hypothetical protein